jgi:hypothetical protein
MTRLALMKGVDVAAAMDVPASNHGKTLVDMAIVNPPKAPGTAKQHAAPEALRFGIYDTSGSERLPGGGPPICVLIRHGGAANLGALSGSSVFLAKGGAKNPNWIMATDTNALAKEGFVITSVKIQTQQGGTYAEVVFRDWPAGDPLIGWDGGDPF